MAQADKHPTTLSQLFTDPDVRAAFWRAEQDQADDFGLMAEVDHPRTLDGGAAAALCGAPVRRARELVDA